MGAPQVRARSPAPGGASLIIWAPKSASMVEQKGPASAWLRSSTLISSSGNCMEWDGLLQRRRHARRQRHFVREQRHSDHDVVADQRAQFHRAARAERFDHALVRSIRNLAVAQHLGGDLIYRELVWLHAIGTAPF